MSIQFASILAVLTASLAFGCSHEEPRRAHHARARTSGGDARHAEARSHNGTAEAEAETEAAEATAPSALDQSESAEDVEITRQIRVAVVSDSSLSFGARNCTIITVGAVVTLRGDVGSEDERTAIAHHAHSVTGVRSVNDMLVVAD